jgi:hypothetical protein
VGLKDSPLKWLGEEISHIVFTFHIHIGDLLPSDSFPSKVMDDVNVLRLAVANRILQQGNAALTITLDLKGASQRKT